MPCFDDRLEAAHTWLVAPLPLLRAAGLTAEYRESVDATYPSLAMKVFLFTLAFIVTVALTALVCTLKHGAVDAQRQVQYQSSVHFPMDQCLIDIVKTYEHGGVALAEQKLWLLRHRWKDFGSGGPPPEQFASEITELRSSSTRPTTAPPASSAK